MHKVQRLQLVLLLFFCNTALLAQTNVTIEINGIDKLLENNVRLYLSIEQQIKHPLLSEGRLHRLHKKAPQEIANAVKPFGYYRPLIDQKLTKSNADQWLATYVIDPGPPLPVAAFNFTISEEMGKDEKFQELAQKSSLKKGETFSHLRYEEFKNSLARLASERGYFNARFTEHRVEIDLDAYEVRIHLHYSGGRRYRFGEVQLEQDVIDDALLQKYIPFERGEPYTLNQLIELQQALNDSNYFQTVEVSPGEPLDHSNEIPITVKLTPRKRHRISIGFGFGTDTGARAKFGWEIPRVNTHGHRFDTAVQVSQIGYNIIANYRVPVRNPRTDQLIYSAGIIHETTDTSDSTIRTVGASLRHSRGDWRETTSLKYQQENFIVADDSGTSSLLIPGINWSRTWGDDFIATIDGLRFDIDLRGASKKMISDADFFQVQSTIKFITSLNSRNRIIARGTAGGTETSEFNELPSSVRFFAGGAQSVRGYAYESLGPINEDGKVVGGKFLLVGSLEFEHSFKNKWGLAVFYDVGNAIDDIKDDLEHGAGFGIRWKSPIGPVRFDLASALSHDGKPWRLHINIGPDL